MMRLSPTSTRPSLLAFAAVALVALLTGLALGSRPTTSVVTGTAVPSGSAAPLPSTAATPTPTPTLTPTPSRATPAPTQSTCNLPPQLPLLQDASVTPAIDVGDLAVVFASHLYAATPGGPAVRDQPDDQWAMGLWIVAPGSNQARLLPAPANGMVLPLALSPTGDHAAIWWMPQRRGLGETSCEGGIYILTIATGRTDLVARGYWTVEPDGEGSVDTWDWRDPHTGASDPRSYDLPEAAFSSDGRYLALADGNEIAVYAPGAARPTARHSGDCTEWAWSPVGSILVAGCESMTTAWHVDVGEGLAEVRVALPPSPFAVQHPGWEESHGQSIGLTRDGRILVARFYGYPTGCEDPDCVIPPTAYGVTTIDPTTGAATHRTTEIDFIVTYENDDSTWLSADASWVYAILADERGAAVARIRTGALPIPTRLRTVPLGTVAGASPDGSTLYGWRADEDVVVVVLDSTGRGRDVGVIGHPNGVISEEPLIATFGLLVAAPSP